MTTFRKFQAFFDAHASRDVTAVREAMTDEIGLSIPGQQPPSGDQTAHLGVA